MGRQIVVVGSLNADLCVSVPRFPEPGETIAGRDFRVVPGGKGANQACAAGRLGGQVSMIGQVGDDAQGAMLKASLRSAGVGVDGVLVDPGAATGVALITIDAGGENQIVLAAGANGTFGPSRLAETEGRLAAARIVLLQLEVPVATVLRAAEVARAAGALVILDPAPAAPLPDGLIALADLLTPNETELAILTGRPAPRGEVSTATIDVAARELLERGARRVLVKLGARGSRLVTASDVQSWQAFPVSAVDTTAAGDAFNGALAVALAEDRPLADAVQFATAAGAISVTRPGAQPSMPVLAEVNDLLRQH